MSSGPSRVSVLVIDDDDVDVEILVRALERCGPRHVLHRAGDAEEGLRRLRAGILSPRLVVLDLDMPGMGGAGFLEVVRGDPKLADLPVFVYSSCGDAKEIARVRALGAEDVVAKAATPEEAEGFARRLASWARDAWAT